MTFDASGGAAAVFLDRDGVLNERPPEHEYVTSPDGFRWLPGSRDALAELASAGYTLIVVSNQRGLARGLLTRKALRAIEDRIRTEAGVPITGFYYCPHDLDDRCTCRKPAPGLLLAAAAEHHLDLASSVMIGDDETDVAAGHAAGCVAVRLGDDAGPSAAELVCSDLAAAAAAIVRGRHRGGYDRPRPVGTAGEDAS